MGVQGLWDLLRPVATKTSLAALGRDAFLANRNGLRAFVIGIDASIWIFHAQTSKQGSNPFLRTLFHKISHLLQHPVLPVFVFDGPNKPAVKRNQRVKGRFGTSDGYSIQFKRLLDACGLEWWNAPGEAEAELALMNRQGKIDAVLSDDVDALLFGATCILRNNSPTLSGATGGSKRVETRFYDMYSLSDIRDAWSQDGSALKTEEDCRSAMVLVGLLSGGDYVPEGIAGLGPSISFGLAQAGASNFLKLYNKDKDAFTLKSSTIHSFMVNELRTNDSGFMKRKNPERARKLDAKLPADVFPGASLEAYLRPARSPEDPALGWPGFGKGEASEIRGMGRNHGRWDLESCARTCERFFEWATIEAVCKKFSGDNGIFTSQIMHEARSRVLEADKRRGRPKASFSRPSLGSEPTERVTPFFSDAEIRRASLPALDDSVPEHILKITSSRPSPMCDQMTELRVSFNPRTYLERATAAMDGTREEMTAERRAELGLVEHPERPESSQRSETEASERAESPVAETVAKHEIRTWVPDYLIRSAWPSVADEHDAAMAAKAAAKATPKKKRAPKAKGVTTEDAQAFKSYFTQPARGASPTSSIAESMGSLALSLSPTSSRRRQKTSSTASATETLEPSATPTPTRARKKTLSKASSTPSPSTSLTAVESPATPIVRRRKGARKIVPVTPESSPTAEVAEAPTAVNTPVPLRRSTRKSRPAMDATATPEEIICSATPSPSPTPVRMSRKKASKEPSPLVAHDKRTHTDVSSSSAASRGTTPRRRSPKKAATVDIRGSSDAPIDLCDSDNDEPPRRASPCRSSPRKTKSKSKTATPPVLQTASLNLPTDETSAGTKSTSKPALQSTLESLIVARARKTAAKPAAPGPETPPPKRKPKYIVSVDADGVEHIYIRGKPPS